MKDFFIKNINIKDVRGIKDFNIDLDENERKHLIITGKNGSGKTSSLLAIDALFNKLINNEWNSYIDSKKQIIKNEYIIEEQENNISIYNKQIEKSSEYGKKSYSSKIVESEDEIIQKEAENKKLNEEIENFSKIDLSFQNSNDIYLAIAKGEFLLANFAAQRINEPNESEGPIKEVFKEKYSTSMELYKIFIQYMVNLHTEKAYAMVDKNNKKVDEIERWFNHFENSLKELFEEKDLKLKFIQKEYDFKIEYGEKSFGLNQLADGYSSLLAILTELILRMEAHGFNSYNMQGVVLIDEIETHLHIDLQKKVMPFLVNFFPKIQFIVTTHSPFVLTSLSNAVICDLELKTVHKDDISKIENYLLNDIISEFFDVDLNKNKIDNPNLKKHKKAKSMLLDLIKTVQEED